MKPQLTIDSPMRQATAMCGYDLVDWLAQGGMAELHLARRAPGELVALKRMLPIDACSTRNVDRFLDEARLLSRLDHPHIARLVEFGMLDGNYAIALEYVHGQTLRSTLRRTDEQAVRFSIANAVRVARNIASALHHAHERRVEGRLLGVVHRDVSPSNIMISYTGDVKLIDFGVASTACSSHDRNTLQGTPRYMSPEQAMGAPLDRRSDVFSLGVVLWEMLAMRPLFAGRDEREVILRVRHARPSAPSRYSIDCPPELDQITAKALALSPSARYQTAAELVRDLDHVAARLEEASDLAGHMQQIFDVEMLDSPDVELAGSREIATVTMLNEDHEITSDDIAWTSAALAMASA